MKYASQTAAQLRKLIRRRPSTAGVGAAHHWAERIESGPRKCCIPKAKLRRAGLLPPVDDLVAIDMPATKDEYPGCIVSDGSSCFMITREIRDGEEVDGEKVFNERRNKWWLVRYPDAKSRILGCLDDDRAKELKWYRRKASPCVSDPSPARS